MIDTDTTDAAKVRLEIHQETVAQVFQGSELSEEGVAPTIVEFLQ